MTSSKRNQTPSFSQVVFDAIDRVLGELNTSMPGQIVNYDETTNLATVKPCLKRQLLVEGEPVEVDYPEIQDVIFGHIQIGDAGIRLPVKSGDECLLMFTQRSLEKWKTNGGVILPGDTRRFHISDCIAVPMLKPSNKTIPGKADDLTVIYGLASIIFEKNNTIRMKAKKSECVLTNDGKVKLGAGSIDVISIISDLLAEIQELTVLTRVGDSSPPVNLPKFKLIAAKIDKIKM